MKNLPILFCRPTRHVLLIVLAVAAYSWIAGCKSTISPEGTGSFAGRIVLFDSTGLALPDFSGVTVSIDGTTMSTTTDSIGRWAIIGARNGTYDISATKLGFGTFHWFEQVVNNGRIDLAVAAIARMSAYTPVLSYAGFGAGVLLFGALTLDSGYKIVGYFDLDSTRQPPDSHLATCDYGLDGYISYDDLLIAGARPGQTLYVSASRVFPMGIDDSYGFVTNFDDPRNHELRWASTGPKSNVIAVKMP